jgi:hypothetical protein
MLKFFHRLLFQSAIRRPALGHLVLFVTLDGSKYVSADVSGSPNAAAVREKIFTAVTSRLPSLPSICTFDLGS